MTTADDESPTDRILRELRADALLYQHVCAIVRNMAADWNIVTTRVLCQGLGILAIMETDGVDWGEVTRQLQADAV